MLLGGTVMLGWGLQLAPLVRVMPEYPQMVLNAAICFALAGSALLVPISDPVFHRCSTAFLGGALVLIASLVLAEHLLQTDLGIDWDPVHAWLPDPLTRGRMPAVAASGFLMGGAALLLALWEHRSWTRTAVLLLTLGVGIIGALGLAGYPLHARLLFSDYFFAGMAIHTAGGLLVLAIGLGLSWRRYEWGQRPRLTKADDRVAFFGGTILAVIALAAGIGSFALLNNKVQVLVGQNVLGTHVRNAEMIRELIQQGERNARIAATRPAVLHNLRNIRSGRDDGSNIANIHEVVDSFLKEGFNAIVYHDIDDRIVAGGGTFTQAPELAVPLATPGKPTLMWNHGFVLRHRIVLRDASGEVGSLLTEQPLPVLTRLSQEVAGMGSTGDIGLCVEREDRLQCFPQRLNSKAFSAPLVNRNGELLPMTRALAGESGTIIVRDYRDQNVVAAFGPIHDLGMGMVVKVDTAEIFQSVREQLLIVLATLAVLVASGTLLLHSIVKPFAAKLVKAEHIAQTQTKTFRGLLESAPDANVIVNWQADIVLVNSQTEKMFGYARDELLGQKIGLLLPERYRDQDRGGRRDVFTDPQLWPMGPGMELIGRRKDGVEFPVEISLGPLETEDGILVSSVIRDITERKRFEQTLREKNRELEQVSRAKDLFLASMSHELRTPLNAIIGFTGTLLMKLPGPLVPEQEKQLRTVQTSARHLLSLINDLLDLSKIDAGKLELEIEAVDCNRVVVEVCALLRPAAEAKGLAFAVALPEQMQFLQTDRRALRQIIINLLGNAIKFTERGQIRVRLEKRQTGSARTIVLSVEDSGSGIREEDHSGLFKAFSQAGPGSRRNLEGSGLGLHLSQELAKRLGGRIVVRSEYGKGSTFTLELPETY